MPRTNAILPFAVAACFAIAAGPSRGDDITAHVDGVSAELATLVEQGTSNVAPFFAAAAELGFAQRASYDVELSPQAVTPADSPPAAKILPFAMVLDAALSKASAQTLDGIADAQGEQGASAIYFEQGPVFLGDIRAALVDLGLSVDSAAPPTELTLSRPLVLSARATLVLLPGEQLTLDRSAGAFLVAAGGMVVDRAAIIGSDVPNAHELDFRPFVLADATTGPVELSGAHFAGLGFGSDPRSAGLSITGGSAEPEGRSFIQDSSFSTMGSLSLIDAVQSTIRRNVFDAPFNTALAISSSATIIVDGNVMMAASPGHGIKLGPNATNILVSDNIVAANNRHGLILEGNTRGSLIFNNLLLANQSSGIAVLSGSCLSLEQNTALANIADGIMLRNSAELNLKTNVVAANQRAGVSIAGNTGVVRLTDNHFDANKIGLRANSSFELSLTGNDWKGQSPRLLDGDIEQYTVPLLAAISRGDGDLSMVGLPLPANGAGTFEACALEGAI